MLNQNSLCAYFVSVIVYVVAELMVTSKQFLKNCFYWENIFDKWYFFTKVSTFEQVIQWWHLLRKIVLTGCTVVTAVKKDFDIWQSDGKNFMHTIIKEVIITVSIPAKRKSHTIPIMSLKSNSGDDK